jgi:hypothetical protein
MSRSLLGRATAYADTVIADLPYDDLRLATPCDGWDIGIAVDPDHATSPDRIAPGDRLAAFWRGRSAPPPPRLR